MLKLYLLGTTAMRATLICTGAAYTSFRWLAGQRRGVEVPVPFTPGHRIVVWADSYCRFGFKACAHDALKALQL